jgi:fatty-acid peroxygenase
MPAPDGTPLAQHSGDEMSAMPRDRSPDSTLAFVRDGYLFVSRRCERYRSDIFETRLLLKRAICVRGRDAAEMFYDPDHFQRHGAAPTRAQKTLLGSGGVQSLDGVAHQHHKRLLMSLLTPEKARDLAQQVEREWRARLESWESARRVVLYDEVGSILCRAVCAWAGVPLPEPEVRQRTDDLRAMIEAPALVGPLYWRGRWSRHRSERWIARLVDGVRQGTLPAAEGSALRMISEYRDHQGRPLDRRMAAVAVLNILRPTVAADRFIAFVALALHEHPQWRERLRAGEAPLEPFVHEVRRYYPFFPVAAAVVRQPFDWRGFHFPRGRRVVLDLYGTDHHPRLWPEPDQFRPDRFRDGAGDAFSLIPQGGGSHYAGHRCAGEWVTIELMKTALGVLTRSISYDVPSQDLSVSLRRMPALPESGVVLTNVRRAPAFEPAPGG